jgi:CRP-like cAMP-binding protein
MISSEQPETHECELDCNLRVLRDLPFFSGQPQELLRVMAYLCERETFAPGQVAFEAGQPAEGAVAVITGTMAIEREGRKVGTLGAGMYAGGLTLLGHYRWLYTLRAETETDCLLLQRRRILPQLVAQPASLSAVARELVESVVFWDLQRLERGLDGNVHGPGVL